MHIGIESYRGLVYEGNWPYGRALWPAPVITPARIVFASEGPLVPARSNDSIHASCRFREDSFDPIARIRRGRFYFGNGVNVQPAEWYVEPHPAYHSEQQKKTEHKKSLETFVGNPIWHSYIQGRRERPLVLLGIDDRFTVWTIVHVEAATTGEDFVTLKARSTLGILPRIDDEKIPNGFGLRVNESLDALSDEAHRAAPVSVIDRARDAASQVLLAHYGLTGSDAKDLGDLVKRLDAEQLAIASSAGRIIARLHARAKPSERQKRSMRAVGEHDAELAVQCVGTLLCELGWATWE